MVVGGIMYVTAAEPVLRARRRHRPADLALSDGRGNRRLTTGAGSNRGVGVAGDRVFMETDHAHVIALNRFTGELLWDAEMADWRQNYFATSAPLAVGNLVIAGVGGGEHGANGCRCGLRSGDRQRGLAILTGSRSRASPDRRRGRARAGAWRRADLVHRKYDPELDTIYWPTGNPARGVQRRRPQGRQPLLGLHPGARSRRPAS